MRRERFPTPWLPLRRGGERHQKVREAKHGKGLTLTTDATQEVVAVKLKGGEGTKVNSWKIRTGIEKVK